MLELDPDLLVAIENAYRIFPERELAPHLNVCNCFCCVAGVVERALVTTPRRDIPADLIREYVGSAHAYDETLIGPELRHFLPRMFELVARGAEISNIGLEVAFTRLGRGAGGADYRGNWAPKEIETIDRFFAALFGARLRREPSPFRRPDTGEWLFDNEETMEPLLCSLAGAGADIAGLLALWDRERSPAATLHVAALINNAMPREWKDFSWLEERRLSSPFWRESPDDERRVATWLLDGAQVDRLVLAIDEETDPVSHAILEEAVDHLLSTVRKAS